MPSSIHFLRQHFSPRRIPGLALWLDATLPSCVTRDASGKVSQWMDRSGKGNHAAQATGSLQPSWVENAINSRPAVQFYVGGTAKLLSAPDSASMDYTRFSLFVVMKRASDINNSEHLVGKYAASSPANQREFRLLTTSGADLAQFSTSADGSSTIISANAGTMVVGTPYLLDASFDGSVIRLTLNDGTPVTTSATTVFNGTSPFYLGARDGSSDPFGGYIGECLFYTQSASAQARGQILKYLSSKWGIAV